MATLGGSVGRNGRNGTGDVKTVQELLNRHLAKLAPLTALTPDGKIGPKTIGLARSVETYE